MSKRLSSDTEFIAAVQSSRNIREALLKLKQSPKGGSYLNFRERCKTLSIDLTHFVSDKQIRQGISDEEIFVICQKLNCRNDVLNHFLLSPTNNTNSFWLMSKISNLEISTNHWSTNPYIRRVSEKPIIKKTSDLTVINGTSGSHRLKLRLIKEGYFENRCYTPDCIKNEWHGKPLSLHLEHINGDHCDNRLENLTLLCPNCHSQTATYSRAKSSFVEKEKKLCVDCNRTISQLSTRCKRCGIIYNKEHAKTKIKWPQDSALLSLLKDEGQNLTTVAKILGVSDSAVRKRLSKRGLWHRS